MRCSECNERHPNHALGCVIGEQEAKERAERGPLPVTPGCVRPDQHCPHLSMCAVYGCAYATLLP